jgi:hypothetical protein
MPRLRSSSKWSNPRTWRSMKPRSNAFFTRSLQIAHAQHCNRALPADPDVALGLWPHLDESFAEELACHRPIEFSPQGDYREGFAQARSKEFFGLRVQNDVVERLRIAIEHCRHHAVAGCCDPVPEDCIYVTARKSQQTSQGPISGLLAPLAEEVENEEERCRFGPCTRVEGKEMLDLLDEQGNHFDTLVRCSLERFCRETLGVGQLVERFPRIVFPSFSAPVITACR